MRSSTFWLFTSTLFLVGPLSGAETAFPELKVLLTEAEWKRAGLDRLTPDEIGVIDAALIRYTVANRRAARIDKPTATPPQSPVAAGPVPPRKSSWLDRFGLPTLESDWRSLPPLPAKVVAWDGPNRFKLDNDQVWESEEAIPYDLVGESIEIRARPNHKFVLVLDGRSTGLRVARVR